MTDTATDAAPSEVDIKSKSKEKEIPVVHDQGFFIHETGDTYNGYFEAKKKDRSAKMHGSGVYTTAEGDIYSGVWDNDRLAANENITISFIDGSKYEGQLKDWCYNGQAKYLYPDGALLQCEFHENAPAGKLHLTDPNGHTWLGKAEQGYGWFNPVNHFFEMLEPTQDPPKIKRRPKSVTEDSGLPVVAAAMQGIIKSKAIVTPKSGEATVATSPVSPSKK